MILKVSIMKRFLFLASWVVAFNSWAQPATIAGIFPGKTTIEELRELVVDPIKIDNNNYHIVKLKELNNEMATVFNKEGVVYKVEIDLMSNLEMAVALTSKYGKPTKKVGEIKKVTCQNKLGGKFERVEGKMVEYWRPKGGVQAALVHTAYQCGTRIYSLYTIYHEKTQTQIDYLNRQEEFKNFSDKIDKINKGI